MARARNRFDRSTQVARWLLHEFPVSQPVSIEWVDRIKPDSESPHGYHGYVDETRGRLTIHLCAATNRTRSQAVESTIHEYAHAYLWEEGFGLCHGPRFWDVFGRLMDAYEHHGSVESAAYPVD